MQANIPGEHSQSLIISAPQIRLLERLCNACGVSGDEREVRLIVLEEIRQYADEIKVDALGNILAVRHGAGDAWLRVMVAAHMDEVGLMIIGDDGDGIFRFDKVGGVDVRKLAGKPVWVGHSHLPGIIGVPPIHLISNEDRKYSISTDSLRIDVGPDRAKKVAIGDRATFGTSFSQMGPSIRAKALDDRIGVASLIELLLTPLPQIDLLAAFTVQEEVGLRGARVAAYSLDPDLAIVLDCTLANDLPSLANEALGMVEENTHYNTRLGGGPAIYIADRATISDPRLIRHLVRTADALQIPFQLRQPASGGTDAGAIHKQRGGIPSISVSVPGRYPHTGGMLVRLEDWGNFLTLVTQALRSLDPEVLAAER